MADSSIINLPNEMVVKPDPGDKFALANISVPSAGETQKIAYSTLTADFLMTNEARTMTAGGLTVNDGIKIKMGTDGDLEFYHSNPISYIANTKTSGKIHIQATNAVPALVDMLILDPTGPTIAIGAANVARENNATHGLDFDAAGNTQIKKELETTGIIRLGENIDLGPHRVSGDGLDHGFTMAGAAAEFSSTVEITDKLTMLENIDMGLNRISGDGADHGLSWTGGDDANFSGKIIVQGVADFNENLDVGTNYISSTGASNGLRLIGANATFSNNVTISGDCIVSSATGDYYHGGNKGSTGTITVGSTTTIDVDGGLITGWF